MRLRIWVVGIGVAALVACGGPPSSLEETTPSLPSDTTNGVATPPPDVGSSVTPPAPTTPDAGSSDAGSADAGAPDAGAPGADAGSPSVGQTPPGEYPDVQKSVPVMDIQISAADQAQLDKDPNADVTVPAVVVMDGVRATAQVSYRGASTRALPQKSYDVELDSGFKFDNRDHFELLASWYDGGKLTEKFAVDVFTAMGLPVPRARYILVSLSGKPNGLYLDMEHVGKDYVQQHGLEKGASVYRCGERNGEMKLGYVSSYQTDFEKKTNETTGRADLDALLLWINRSDDADFEAKLEKAVDVEDYLGNLAADMLISNNIIEDARSYWIHELSRDRWSYTPWDLNNAQMLWWRTWAPTDPPIVNRWPQAFSLYDPWVQRNFETRVVDRPSQQPTWSVLNTRIWDRPALRTRMLAKLEAALNGPFSETKAIAHIDALWAVVGPQMAVDPYASPQHVARARDFLVQYVRGRRAFLLQTLQTLKNQGTGPLVIQNVATGSSGYVELYNRGTSPLALKGYEVTSDLRATTRFALSAFTLAPGQVLRLVADGNSAAGPTHLPFTLSTSGGEVGVFNGNIHSASGKPQYYAPEDAIYFGPLPTNMVYGRKTLGSEDFGRQARVP